MSFPVFVASEGELSATVGGDTLSLTGSEGHHAAAAQRIGAGEMIDLVDGAGRRVRCEVRDANKFELSLVAVEVTDEPAPKPRLVLVQALAKSGRDETAVETCTEIGVDVILPWQASRSVPVWKGAKAQVRRERWSSIALASAKQARRARIPEVREVLGTSDLACEVKSARERGALVLVAHELASEPLSRLPLRDPNEIWVVVGPEGGISDEELDLLAGAGARPVLLGPTVLRTSSAGAASLAVLSARIGRW